MAKGWTVISRINEGNNASNPYEKYREINNFQNKIRNTKSLDAFELKQKSDKLYEKRIAYENQLIENKDKLKSDTLKAEAQRIINSREKHTKDDKNVKV